MFFLLCALGTGALLMAATRLHDRPAEHLRDAPRSVDWESHLLPRLLPKSADTAQAYLTNCAPCHGAAGEGKVGPSFLDGAWRHGDDPVALREVVRHGIEGTGMPPWTDLLGPGEITALTEHVWALAERPHDDDSERRDSQSVSSLSPSQT
ncbi:MAG: c-type cytochrome [Acidobacteriota bacterium]